MSVEQKLLTLEEDIEYVKENAEFFESIIMSEAYPSNPDSGESSSVYTFIEVTMKLAEDLESIIKEAKQ